MKILSIDPGNTMSAWVEYVGGKPIRSDKVSNQIVLSDLRTGHADMGDLVAIEMIASYGMAVGKEVFETCLWIGRFIEAWENRGGRVRLVYRKDVKLFLCESARATDANIRASIIDRYGPGKEVAIGYKAEPGPLYGMKGDTWSALAVAMTAEHQELEQARKAAQAQDAIARTAAAEAQGQAF